LELKNRWRHTVAAKPDIHQKPQKKKGRAPVDPVAHKHAMWLPLALPPGMETSSYWKKYVSFEGDVPVTGALCMSDFAAAGFNSKATWI
jgi:hypothetical protein